jgi:transposase InsO family protein
MGVARSSYYAEPEAKPRDEEIIAEIRAITDAFEGYGYRRVGAELRHRGFVVNAKKVRRLMREHDLNPRRRRRQSKSCSQFLGVLTLTAMDRDRLAPRGVPRDLTHTQIDQPVSFPGPVGRPGTPSR